MRFYNKLVHIFNIALVLTFFMLPVFTFAAEAEQDDLKLSDKFITAVSQYFNYGLAAAIISAILVIVFAGYTIVIAAGNTGTIARGKKMLFNALLGLSIAILAAVILNFLNPRILNVDETADQTPSTTTEEVTQ